jgi:hypothetical protein
MRRIAWCAALLPLLFPAATPAAPKTVEITVAAGKTDRVQTPVSVPLTLPDGLAKVQTATLFLPDGKVISGQLTAPGLLADDAPAKEGEVRRELYFILPALKAGDSVTFKAEVSGALPAPPSSKSFSWHDTPGEYTELRFGDRPVLRYMYKAIDESSKEKRDATFKVFHHLYDPEGKRIVTNGPGGKYPHHRGLFFGFKNCVYGDKKDVDTWHCTKDTYEGHEKFLAEEAGPVLGRQRVEIAWHGVGKEVFVREERELTVYAVPGGQLVEFASRLKPTMGPVKLGGDPQHSGFHFRADNEVSDKSAKETYFVRPDGTGKPGETRNWPERKDHVNLPWLAMSFVLGDRRYTAAYLDRPANPKEARFSERDYGRFGSYFEYELTEQKPLAVDYRLWLQDGEMKGEEVAAKDADFVTPPEVKVK